MHELSKKGKHQEVLIKVQGSVGTHPLSDEVSDSEKAFAKLAYDLTGVQKEKYTVCSFMKACENSGRLSFDDVLSSWIDQAPNDLQKRIRPEVVKDITPLYHFNQQTIKHFKEALFCLTKTNPITSIETYSHKPDGYSLNGGALKHARLNEYPIKFEMPKFIISELVDGRVIS